jgi:membrane fusion protein (multidrug efflux system)
MSVSFEPNLKRRHHRVTVPLYLRIGDESFRATDWSVGGFRVDDYRGHLQPGDEFEAVLLLPYSEFSVQLPVKARIARRDGQTIGCAFIELTTAQQAALHHLVEAAMEGRLGDLGEMLDALRTPVPAPERRLAEDTETTDLQARQMRLMPRAVLYLCTFGAVTLLMVGAILYLASRVRVPDGAIVGNLVRVSAPAPGRIARVAVAEGQAVQAGEVLFTIDDPDVRAAYETAQARVQTAAARQQAAQGELAQEKSRLALYADVLPFQIARAEAALKQTEARLRNAKAELERQQSLVQARIGAPADYDAALSAYEVVAAEREEGLMQLGLLRLNSQAVADGQFFDGKEIQGRVRELEAAQSIHEAALQEARRELDRAAAKLERLAVRAPAAGKVYAVLRPVGENVSANHPVIALQTSDDFLVVGNLAADEAVRVKPGMPVRVKVPTLNLELKGTVAQIGLEAPASETRNSAEMETSLKLVPIKVRLQDAPKDLPPGIRAVLLIRANPWLKAFTW